MSDPIKMIALDEIVVTDDRSRALNQSYVPVLADGIARDGLFHPIHVRATPNAKGGKFTLVSGLHRLAAVKTLGWPQIEARVVKADQREARRLEVEENLRRNDLTVLERANAIFEMRRLWEEENGAIERGNPALKTQLDQVDPIAEGDREVGTFLASAADRIGFSEPALKRLVFIAQNIIPDLQTLLHGRAEADHQSLLLRVAKTADEEQLRAVALMTADRSLPLADALDQASLAPKPSKDPQTVFYSRAYDTFTRMSAHYRKKLLVELGVPEDIAAKVSRRAIKENGDA